MFVIIKYMFLQFGPSLKEVEVNYVPVIKGVPKKSPMFDQFPSISANMGDFFLGHTVDLTSGAYVQGQALG